MPKNIDLDMQYVGPVIGLCGTCMKAITDGPGGNTMNYSCACHPRNPWMFAQEERSQSQSKP